MKSGIHHWLVFVGRKAAGNKFILEGRYLWFKHTQGEQRGYFHPPGSAKGEKEITPGQPLSSVFTTWWKNSPDFTEMAPLAASLEAPVTFSWKCWVGKSDSGVESATRHLICPESPYQEVFLLRSSTSGFPQSADPEMWVCVRAIWECLLKYRFPGLPSGPRRYWPGMSREEPRNAYFDKLASILAFRCIWFMEHILDQHMLQCMHLNFLQWWKCPLFVLLNTAATGLLWLLGPWNVASVTDEWNFLIVFNLNLFKCM